MIEPAKGEKNETISSGGKKHFSSVGKKVNFRSKNLVSTCAERIFDVHMMTLHFDSEAPVL